MSNKLVQKRLKKTRFVGKLLMLLPFVRCVILNGSLASGGHKHHSDIDLLIIAKSGRIFTCRFFVNSALSMLRLKRKKDATKSHAGKVCTNYFQTENFLSIPVGRGEKMDKYCAKNYSSCKFVAGDYRLFNKFLKENNKLFDLYGYSCDYSKGLPYSRSLIQKLLESVICKRLESFAKDFQLKRIHSAASKYPDLVVCNDKEMRFHPPKLS